METFVCKRDGDKYGPPSLSHEASLPLC
jgi:hypothetical protein